MNPIRTIIADDERLARTKLRLLLGAEDGIQIVAECADYEQTVQAVRNCQPDLLLLDVQMPGPDGFQVLRAIPPERMPMVIFTTAYDQYALKAFEASALGLFIEAVRSGTLASQYRAGTVRSGEERRPRISAAFSGLHGEGQC